MIEGVGGFNAYGCVVIVCGPVVIDLNASGRVLIKCVDVY